MSFDYARGAGSSTTVPASHELAVSGSGNNTWLKGAPLILSSGALVEAGADPASIGGIALHDVGSGSGSLYPLGRKEFPPNRAQFIQLEDFLLFYCLYSGTLPSTVGTAYGITKDSDSKWKVDFAKTGATVTRVTLVDLGPTTTPQGSAGTAFTPRVGVIFTPTANFTIARI